MNDTLTIPVEDAIYLTPAQRMICRDAIAAIQLSYTEYVLSPPPRGDFEATDLLRDLQKMMDLV